MAATYEQFSTGTPDHDYVFQLIEGYCVSAVMMAAAELDIIPKIESGSDVTAKYLATSSGWDESNTERLLNALVALKLLAKSTTAKKQVVYSVTSAGRLLSSSADVSLHSLATKVKSNATTMFNLANTVKKGKVQFEEHQGCDSDQKHGEHQHSGGDSVQPGDCHHGEEKPGEHGDGEHGSGGEEGCEWDWVANQTPEQLLEMYKSSDSDLAPHAPKIVKFFDLSKHRKGVDLGGGSGVLSFALARAYPKMEVVLNDMPNVIEMVKKYFNPEHEELNITFEPGDYFKTELPKADLFIVGMLAHHWTPEESAKNLKQIYHTLPEGGAVLMLDTVVNDTYDGPLGAMIWDVYMMTEGHERTRCGRDFREMLMKAGFEDVQIKLTQNACSYDLIYATKA